MKRYCDFDVSVDGVKFVVVNPEYIHEAGEGVCVDWDNLYLEGDTKKADLTYLLSRNAIGVVTTAIQRDFES